MEKKKTIVNTLVPYVAPQHIPNYKQHNNKP